MSRLLVVGLTVAIVVLAFNYFITISRNAETSRELSRVKLELQSETPRRLDALKKWELCREDVTAARDNGKKLQGKLRQKDLMIADLTKQISENRKREMKLKEEIDSLNVRVSAANAEAKAEREKLLEAERRKCYNTTRKKTSRGKRKTEADQP